MSEIYVPEGSNYVGISITDTKLYENDINVLTLYRGNKVIPNPRANRILEAEDKLLCYGKLEAMRGMVPVKTRRRRRPAAKQLVTEVPTGTHPTPA
ncbi:MAG: cation:proton antiporter regulatory subunit [Granulosicoccus sp.]